MNTIDIEKIINEIKVDSAGRLRNKGKVIDKIRIAHLKALDKELMDVRVFVAKFNEGNSSGYILKAIDDFIYKQQTK